MKTFIKRHAISAWAGGSLAAAGWTVTMWQFYAVMVPFGFLLAWRDLK